MPMISRLRVLALFVAALALAGCTSTITGHGTLAADSGQVDPTDPPPDDPTADPGGGGNGTVTRTPGAEANSMCQIYSDDDIASAFGEPVTVDVFVGAESCKFEVSDGGFVIVSHWEFLTPREDAETGGLGDYQETTFAGRPALRNDTEIIVSVNGGLDASGAVDGSEVLFDTDRTGDAPVLSPLLEQAVNVFADQ